MIDDEGAKIMKQSFYGIIIIILSTLIMQLSCAGQIIESQTGTLLVLIVDNDYQETPISDVAVIVTPGNIINTTDSNGLCTFTLEPGEYYVDAEVCCIGPGYIQYHEYEKILPSTIKILKLYGCLSCE